MTHPPDWSFPSAFIDDALAADERTLFEEHLAGCAACRAEVATLRELKSRFAAAPRRPLPPALRALLARRGRPPLWRRVFVPARTPRWAAAGLATAAVALLAIWAVRHTAATPAAIDLQPLMAAHADSAMERPMPVNGFYDADAAGWASYEGNDAPR